MSGYVFISLVAFLLYFQVVVYYLRIKPAGRTRNAFVAMVAALACISLFYALFHFSNRLETIYLFDRFASLGWAFFPLFTTVFLFSVSRLDNRWVKQAILFVLLPLALTIFLRYQWDPSSAKSFYRASSGIWYFTAERNNVWFYVSLFYNTLSALLGFYVSWKWKELPSELIGNKRKKQARIIFYSLIFFVFTGFFSNIVLPFLGSTALPALIHLAAGPFVFGVFISLVFFDSRSYFREVVSGLFIDRVRELIFFLDFEGRIFSVNQHAVRFLQFSSADLKDKEPGELMEEQGAFSRAISNAFSEKITQSLICKMITGDGERLPVHLTILPLQDTFRNISGFILVGVDYRHKFALHKQLSERKQAETSITRLFNTLEKRVSVRKAELMQTKEEMERENLLREKAEYRLKREVKQKKDLLGEIHHRVKNNIQITLSLVSMSCTSLEPDSNSQLMEAIGRRIRGISSIHEFLYDFPLMSKIPFSPFIERTVAELNKTRSLNHVNITVDVQEGEDELGINEAISCGILLYELLGNALMHAFLGAKKTGDHQIGIGFVREGQQYKLMVRDNGRGMVLRQGLPDQSDGVGFFLIDLLVKDHLKGKWAVYTREGTRVEVVFPALKEVF